MRATVDDLSAKRDRFKEKEAGHRVIERNREDRERQVNIDR
jgi:hypothetical protein